MRLTALAALVISCLAAAAATEAQQAGKIYRIGVLETRNATLSAANIEAFRRGLRELGYKDGQVELLREMLPRLTRIAGLFNMGNPVLPIQWNVTERAARSLGMQPQLLDVRRPEELARAFDTAAKEHAGAMVVALDGVTQANLLPIAELAAKHRLPTIFATSEYVDVGGLMSYEASDPDLYQRAAAYVDKPNAARDALRCAERLCDPPARKGGGLWRTSWGSGRPTTLLGWCRTSSSPGRSPACCIPTRESPST